VDPTFVLLALTAVAAAGVKALAARAPPTRLWEDLRVHGFTTPPGVEPPREASATRQGRVVRIAPQRLDDPLRLWLVSVTPVDLQGLSFHVDQLTVLSLAPVGAGMRHVPLQHTVFDVTFRLQANQVSRCRGVFLDANVRAAVGSLFTDHINGAQVALRDGTLTVLKSITPLEAAPVWKLIHDVEALAAALLAVRDAPPVPLSTDDVLGDARVSDGSSSGVPLAVPYRVRRKR